MMMTMNTRRLISFMLMTGLAMANLPLGSKEFRGAVASGWAASGSARAAAAEPELPDELGITAESAIVMSGDEVLGIKNPDERRAMASTTKMMTALIAIERAQLPRNDPRFRSLDSWVTVGSYPIHSDQVGDRDDGDPEDPPQYERNSLLQYERLRLRDLLYLMLLISDNAASQAIAEHVVGQVSDRYSRGREINALFAGIMNDRAEELGLNDTHYLNPSGRDPEDQVEPNDCSRASGNPYRNEPNCGRYSTARDLAKLARVALRNPTFASIVRAKEWPFTRFEGYSFATTLTVRNDKNTELLDAFPGATGVKTGTSGQAGACLVASATLLGKTVIAVVMNSQPYPGQPPPPPKKKTRRFEEGRDLLHYGFDVLFDLDRKTSASQAGAISNVEITPLSPSRVVTAVRDSNRNLKVTGWTVGVDGSITERHTVVDNVTGRVSEIAIATMGAGKVVTAVRDSDGDLKLISWSVDGNSRVTRLGESDNLGLAGSQIAVQGLSGSRAVTAMKTATGVLQLSSWRLNADGGWTQLDRLASTYFLEKLGITSYCTNCTFDNFDPPTFRVIAGVKQQAAGLKLVSWNIDDAGNIDFYRASAATAESTEEIAINYQAVYGSERIITAARNNNGNLELTTWKFSNGRIERVADSGTQAGEIRSEIRMAGLAPGWLVTAVQTGSSDLKLISWRFAKGETEYMAGISRFIDSGSQASFVSELALCQLTGNTYVTAVKLSDVRLKLISWKVE